MRRLVHKVVGLFRKRRAEAEMARELASHLALLRRDIENRGVPPAEAARAAALALGGLEQAKERHREARGFAALGQLARDVRQAARSLRRAPTFAVAAMLTLALGIGATAAVFSVVESVLLEPLHYPHPEQLVSLRQLAPGARGLASITDGLPLSRSMYFTYAGQNRSFSALGVWTKRTADVTERGVAEQVPVVYVSDGVLEALAVPPALGRRLLAADQDPHGGLVVLLSDGYWRRRFGGDPAVIGRTLTVDANPRQIVGVMPPGFRVVNADADLILPAGFDRAHLILAGFDLNGLARLKPGVSIPGADADLRRMLPIWMHSWSNGPGSDPSFYLAWRITPALRPLKQDVVGNLAPALWAVMATIGLVMLIACANVANLFFARTESRQHELAIRAALGAGAARTVRGLLVESVLLALAGGVFGIVLARAGLRLLQAIIPANLALLGGVAMDARTIAFTAAIALVAGLLSGLIPALRYARVGPALALHAAGRAATASRRRHRARNALVAAQVGMALVLLVTAGLLIRTFQALRTVQPGFTDAASLQTFRLLIPGKLVADARVTADERAVLDRLLALPGVSGAAFASELPLEGDEPGWDTVYVAGQPLPPGATPPLRYFKVVSPGYFRVMGTRLLAGRELTWDDIAQHRLVAIVSANLARELWGGPAAALGQHLSNDPSQPWSEVVGVAEDVRENGIRQPPPATVYWPPLGLYPNSLLRHATFVVRSPQAGSQILVGQLRRAVASVSASLLAAATSTMQDIYDRSLALASFTMVMLAIAAAMALALGLVGIYGVIAYEVSQRRREIGIRMALGARPREVRLLFVRQALRMATVGAGIGLVAAMAAGRLLRALLFGVSPFDPLTFVAVAAVLAVAVVLAAYLPARRASAVAPLEVLAGD